MNLLLPLAAIAIGYFALRPKTESSSSGGAPPEDDLTRQADRKLDQICAQADFVARMNDRLTKAGAPTLTAAEMAAAGKQDWRFSTTDGWAGSSIGCYADAMNVDRKPKPPKSVELLPYPGPPLSSVTTQLLEDMANLYRDHVLAKETDSARRSQLVSFMAEGRDKVDAVAMGTSATETITAPG